MGHGGDEEGADVAGGGQLGENGGEEGVRSQGGVGV